GTGRTRHKPQPGCSVVQRQPAGLYLAARQAGRPAFPNGRRGPPAGTGDGAGAGQLEAATSPARSGRLRLAPGGNQCAGPGFGHPSRHPRGNPRGLRPCPRRNALPALRRPDPQPPHPVEARAAPHRAHGSQDHRRAHRRRGHGDLRHRAAAARRRHQWRPVSEERKDRVVSHEDKPDITHPGHQPAQQPQPNGASGKGPTEWFESRVGVGPWEQEYPGVPLPTEEHFDPELLAHGDRRNVVDAYRYWKMDAIVADIDSRRHELHIAIENFENDANIGTVVRTANAFAVDTVHLAGRNRANRRGEMVTDRYQHLEHHKTVAEVLDYAAERDLAVVAVDNTPGSVPLETAELPRRCLLLFGQEGPGVTEEAQ